MSLLGGFFDTKKKVESAVVIDVGAESVGGAYACLTEGELPSVLYTCRLPVEAHAGETREKAMLRALKILGDTLVLEGAPVLARTTGNGSAGSIIVSIDAPWQKISVRTEHLESEAPFIFTRNLVEEKLKKTAAAATGKVLVDESVIGTILNGYETREPYGKIAHRASVVVLTSFIDEDVAGDIASTLHSTYHTKNILPIAGSSLHCQAMREAFPHERDALIVDATGPVTSIALVRKGLFVAIVEVPGADAAEAWLTHVKTELAEFGRRYPLPRTIFLLAPETQAIHLRDKLNTANLAALWLSDNPPKIIPVLASHLVGLVRQVTTASPDLLLLLMALYWQHSLGEDR